MDLQFFALVFLLALAEACAQFKPAQPCNPKECLLPNCRCSENRKPPGGLTPEKTPQIIMVTFDDGIEQRFYDLYIELLEELRNPNGCPAVGTLFNCHVGTNYFLVETAYSHGFEIADHTVTHQGATHYENANYTVWKNDIDGQREILHRFANIPYEEVAGFRAPDLMFTENMFKVLFTSNFTYDLSWPVNPNFDGLDAMYPYTLNYLSTEPCPTPEEPCPKMSYPGLWEIPNVNIMNKDGTTCASMMDGCDPGGDATAWYDRLVDNFHQYHYDTNRAPFGMHMHVTFFLSAKGSDHMIAAKKFLKYAEDLGDVWILTPSQVIAWMKDPQNIEQAKSFVPWQCPERPKPRCDSSTVNGCHYTVKGEQVYMFTCTKCPPHYPTPTNPDGN